MKEKKSDISFVLVIITICIIAALVIVFTLDNLPSLIAKSVIGGK